MESQDENFNLDTIFTEPPRPPTPKSTFVEYIRDSDTIQLEDSSEIKIRLVGSHPLWAHHLWNAALALASYLDSERGLYKDKYVLELGAGGALPSIITVVNGAKRTVITDYPDKELVDNIQFNVSHNVNKEYLDRVEVQGYIWGQPVEYLLSNLTTRKFDLVILSDLIFNHTQHDALLETCNLVLSTSSMENSAVTPCVLVFYSHHRPHLAHKDMEFFAKARKNGWQCEEILTRTFPVMFPNDSGDESVRSTVHGWKLTRQGNISLL